MGFASTRRSGASRTALRVIGSLVVVTSLVTACGSSSKSASSSGTPGTSSSSTQSTQGGSGGGASSPSGSPLVVGVVSTDTSPSGYSSQVPVTVGIWQNWVNGHGGVAGHPVKVIEKDDHNDPAQSTTIVNTFISQHVLAVVDDSSVDQAWAKSVSAANIPVICASATGNGFTCSSNPDFIPTGNTVIAGVFGQAKAAQIAGAKSLGILYANEEAAAAEAVPLQKMFAKQVGIAFGYAGAISATAPNYTAQCLAAKDGGVDALFPEEQPSRVAQDCASQGFHPIYVQAQGAVYSNYKNNPVFDGSVGVIGTAPWWSATNPGVTEFQQAFSKYNPDLDAFTTPYTVMETWSALQLFAAATAKATANPPTAADVNSAIYTLGSGFTLNGLIPPETLVPGKNHANPCFFILGIKNKNYVLPYGDKPYCQPGVAAS
jgi:branched-chain amino acid transport system substrate-binding protein